MSQEAIRAFYNCGLQEAAAVDAARAVGMPPRMGDGGEFDGPSWVLYRYWLSQDPSFRYAPSGDELRDHLTRLRFRPEVLPLASFQEGYIPHLDARNWARRLASNVHKQISNIPPMPPAKL
uniref:Cytochrome P450 monooxygenase AKT7 ) n=1 Tax=Ganoderma boninense TaxID=34458 RepID=A0A5K1K1M9_9APHY|nr:Cytochrome P450 monooxygenase AKT7 (EC (AK-toxin biosynthesis protein 7) [Ganoderma boninense]